MEQNEKKDQTPEEITSSEQVENTNPTTETEPSLEDQLAAAKLEAEENLKNFQYAKAESENIRRRSADEVIKAQKFAVERFSREIIAVKDSLDAALAVEVATLENYKDGMELTAKQLISIFEKFNISEVNPVGEKLDPHKHQAISMIDSDQPANTVINVMQKGYCLHDRVLRPAMVVVAKSN